MTFLTKLTKLTTSTKLTKITKKCRNSRKFVFSKIWFLYCIWRLKAIKKQMSHVKAETEEEKDDVKELGQDLLRRHEQLAQMEQLLPAESGTYLKIILGNVNVSILDKKARYDYKDQYEQFKLIVNLIGFVLSCTNLYIQYRVLDLLFMFLIVWYYCTLTIRESILRVNGSRIKVKICL